MPHMQEILSPLMAGGLPFTGRLKAVAEALGITCHQHLPAPPDRRSSELVWNGKLSARHSYIAGKLWDGLNAEIAAGGYSVERKRANAFDLKTARLLLGTRDQFVELARRQFSSQEPNLIRAKIGASKPLLANSTRCSFCLPFSVEWVLFAPFCPGADAKANRVRELKCKNEDQISITFSVQGISDLELRWFKWGTAVWTHRISLELPNLTTLGVRRANQYHELLHGDHFVRSLTKRINDSIKAPPESKSHIGYVLSLYSLNKPGWEQELTPHALKAMSCPSILLEPLRARNCDINMKQFTDNEGLLEQEMRLLCEGVHSPDLHEFSHPGLLHGYASWAGVSVHIAEPMREHFLESCTAFEQELQALWWRLHSISSCLEITDQVAKHDGLLQTLRCAVRNALRIGPTEPTPMRLFKEALIATSRFKSIFEEFQQLCCNRNEFR